MVSKGFPDIPDELSGPISGDREVIGMSIIQQVGTGAQSHGLHMGLEPGLLLATLGIDTRAIISIYQLFMQIFLFTITSTLS